MEKDYNSIVVNQDIFTIDDAREAAKQLFEVQVDDFYALKNEKWYKHFLNAITLGSDRKKKVIKDIRSLSKLQTIFMRVYCENYKGLDSQLNDIIENIAKTNESIKKIYVNYIVGVKSQQSIFDLSQLDQDILLLLLCSYSSNNGNNDKLKKFRAGVAQTIGRGIPETKFKPEMLEQIKSGDVIYRFIVEMCAIDGGLDDFSVPDNIYEAINYLTISNKTKESIESQIRNELENFGVDYLIAKYGGAEENLIDEYVELIENDAVNEEFTTIVIDKELKITEGKQQIYKNKEILVHANVICEGELIFDNCILKYNDSALSGEIKIEGNGKLNIIGCTFICLSYKDHHFITCYGKVIIKYTNFFDCSYLFYASNDFYVEQCEVVNCATRLFSIDSDSNITFYKNKILQNDLKQFYKDDLSRIDAAMIEVWSRRGSCKNVCQFNNNVIKEDPRFVKIFKDKDHKFIYIRSEGLYISQSTFLNTSGRILSQNVEECYFKGCKTPITWSFCCEFCKKIENCIFEECEDVIKARSNLKIKNCQFVSCKNKLINCHDAYDGGVMVDSCTFKNVQNDLDGKEFDYLAVCKASALYFRRSKSGSSKENRIINCCFDGVRMNKAFLIAIEGYEKPREDIVVLVDKCTFSHCVSQRKSKKLIREYFSYQGLFNKEKSVHATQISNCKGLVNILVRQSRQSSVARATCPD